MYLTKRLFIFRSVSKYSPQLRIVPYASPLALKQPLGTAILLLIKLRKDYNKLYNNHIHNVLEISFSTRSTIYYIQHAGSIRTFYELSRTLSVGRGLRTTTYPQSAARDLLRELVWISKASGSRRGPSYPTEMRKAQITIKGCCTLVIARKPWWKWPRQGGHFGVIRLRRMPQLLLPQPLSEGCEKTSIKCATFRGSV